MYNNEFFRMYFHPCYLHLTLFRPCFFSLPATQVGGGGGGQNLKTARAIPTKITQNIVLIIATFGDNLVNTIV